MKPGFTFVIVMTGKLLNRPLGPYVYLVVLIRARSAAILLSVNTDIALDSTVDCVFHITENAFNQVSWLEAVNNGELTGFWW